MSPNVVRNTVRDAYRRCGLPYTRVHLLRHTLASRLVDTGDAMSFFAVNSCVRPAAQRPCGLAEGVARFTCVAPMFTMGTAARPKL